MYDGNTDLCGAPLQNCTGNTTDPDHGNEMASGKNSEPLSFYFGLSSGYVIGLWVVFFTLLFTRSWRIAFFPYFN
jgi:hypothetical protein